MEAGRKPKVLIVDDTPENIQVLMEALKDQYTIVAALNGEKALRMAVAEPRPDLILLDIMMPGMDGYEVCRRLKALDQAPDIPIIFVTAKTEVEDETLGFELGAMDYITKPFSIPVVKARVKAHLDLKRLRDLEASQRAKLEAVLGKLNYELAEAADYAKFLLPQPLTEGPLQANWRFVPSTALGGDALGYHWIDEDSFAIYLIDVCGHGVGAALHSVSVLNVLRSQKPSAHRFPGAGPGSRWPQCGLSYGVPQRHVFYRLVRCVQPRVSPSDLRQRRASPGPVDRGCAGSRA